jgi:hypothetical protein
MKSILNLMCSGVHIIASIPREISPFSPICHFHVFTVMYRHVCFVDVVVPSISIAVLSNQVFVTGKHSNSRDT